MLDNNSDFFLCIKRIEKWFRFDTLILLDCVLTDDINNPELSANTTYSRLEDIIKIHNYLYGKKYKNLTDFLTHNGYTKEDVELFEKKCIEETKRHSKYKTADGSE